MYIDYEALVSFEKVYAPFDGVITARNTDIGDLINSGSNTAARTDLFDIVQPGTLRVYVNVPEEYSRGVKPGETAADIVLAEFPGDKFPGKLVRTADAINGTTRTLLTEVDVENPKGTLLSGSYAEVHLKIPGAGSYLLASCECFDFSVGQFAGWCGEKWQDRAHRCHSGTRLGGRDRNCCPA